MNDETNFEASQQASALQLKMESVNQSFRQLPTYSDFRGYILDVIDLAPISLGY